MAYMGTRVSDEGLYAFLRDRSEMKEHLSGETDFRLLLRGGTPEIDGVLNLPAPDAVELIRQRAAVEASSGLGADTVKIASYSIPARWVPELALLLEFILLVALVLFISQAQRGQVSDLITASKESGWIVFGPTALALPLIFLTIVCLPADAGVGMLWR